MHRWPRITPTTPVRAMPVMISSTPNAFSFACTTPLVRVSCSAQLGMRMQVVPPLGHLAMELGDAVDDRHVLSLLVR